MDIFTEIDRLKKERGALILAHNYTVAEVQDVADFVGDSLELSQQAAVCEAAVIVFCGVKFMAETAKILSPNSIVLHPNEDAGCPMADMADPESIAAYRREHPETVVVAYVNTTAATKTQVDICCTSGNAEKVIAGIPRDKQILFLPDGNLGRNLADKLHREMELWPGYCPIHNRILPELIVAARAEHPAATVLVHPECLPAVVKLADHSLSTGGMLKYVQASKESEFIIGTEVGILHRLQKENPGKRFYSVTPEPLCPNMKKITLEHVFFSLRDLKPQIELDAETIAAARIPIDRMLAVKP